VFGIHSTFKQQNDAIHRIIAASIGADPRGADAELNRLDPPQIQFRVQLADGESLRSRFIGDCLAKDDYFRKSSGTIPRCRISNKRNI
jgi:hypothetical protein